MKALDEYFLRVMFTSLLSRFLVFAIFMFTLDRNTAVKGLKLRNIQERMEGLICINVDIGGNPTRIRHFISFGLFCENRSVGAPAQTQNTVLYL